MEVITATLVEILSNMLNFGILVLGLVISKYFFQLTSSYKFNAELTEKDNPAFGVALAGYLIGSGIALSGAVFGTENTLEAELIRDVGIVLIIILMRLSLAINDMAILHSFSISKEISKDRNSGVGFVVAGSSIATGFMLYGVFSGYSDSFMIGLRDIVIYWIVGQVILIIGGFLFQTITKYDMHKVIGIDDNLPAGISFGGFLVALGMITKNALHGASSQIGEEIIVTIIFALVGMVILVLSRVIVDKVFLPESPLSKEVETDRNPAAGALAAASFIVIAILFSAAINPVANSFEPTDSAQTELIEIIED
ncbi:MAG: DUF350 domain-containing protein [Calditrichaeota bacterium]|nr:DUF350 domain-containing protein [Calditrichota bacterium]